MVIRPDQANGSDLVGDCSHVEEVVARSEDEIWDYRYADQGFADVDVLGDRAHFDGERRWVWNEDLGAHI